MIRLSRALVRRDGMAEHEFGPLHERFMMAFAAEPLVARYVKSYVAMNALTSRLPGQPPRRFDGMIELWFDDMPSLRDFMNHPAYDAAIGAGERELLDVAARNDVITVDLPPIFGGGQLRPGYYSADMIRFTTLLVRGASFSFEEFVHHHRTHHVPLFISVPAVRKHVERYVVSHRLEVGAVPHGTTKTYDGIVDFFFHDVVGMGAVFANVEYLAKVRPDEQRFLNLPACDFIIGKEINVAGSS